MVVGRYDAVQVQEEVDGKKKKEATNGIPKFKRQLPTRAITASGSTAEGLQIDESPFLRLL